MMWLNVTVTVPPRAPAQHEYIYLDMPHWYIDYTCYYYYISPVYSLKYSGKYSHSIHTNGPFFGSYLWFVSELLVGF